MKTRKTLNVTLEADSSGKFRVTDAYQVQDVNQHVRNKFVRKNSRNMARQLQKAGFVTR